MHNTPYVSSKYTDSTGYLTICGFINDSVGVIMPLNGSK